MKRNFLKIASLAVVLMGVLASCHKDLDRFPTNDVTSSTVYKDADGYKVALAKVYGSMATTGNSGPAGNGDIRGIDEGTSDYIRLFWKAQELSTDEAVVAWNDPGIQDFHNMNWSANNPMLIGLYNRIFYVITVANEFIRESEDGKLADRGISGADAEAVKKMRAEARFIRAYQYWVAIDLFGNVPYITETDMIGSTAPKQINRADLFKYVETELKALETELVPARQNEYGRADQAACWALLARFYLNAQVYANENRNTDAITYAKKVISAGYDIESTWKNLFLADNHKSTKEFIWTINYDGNKTKNWGGMTFLVHASIGDNMNPKDFGVNGGWYGIRTTKAIPALYKYINTDSADKRAVFVQNKLEIDDMGKFSDGWAVAKYRNVDQAGKAGADVEGNFVDTDFPVFRLPEMYLVVAEAVLRGGAGATKAEAITYLEKLRKRGFPTTVTTLNDIDLVYVQDERVRELLWEGHRRTDLIRFGQFTSNSYLWPWKGGVKEGRGVADHLKLYPLPTTDVNANPNLVQNPGY